MTTITLDEAQRAGSYIEAGTRVAFTDLEGSVRIGTIRIKSVHCGRAGCTKCPHAKYAYAQYRVGDKVKEKYIGIAR